MAPSPSEPPKIKGTNVLSVVKALRAHRVQALASLPARLHHYLVDRILVSSWYPESDHLALMRALATILPQARDLFPMMGRMVAREDLAGIYRGLLRPGDPAQTLVASAALWRNYHNTGAITTTLESPLIDERGYGGAAREWCQILSGYLSELAIIAGGQQVQIAELSCCLAGSPACSWRVTWR
jgi:hypothetical protein